ncbi:MAG: phosphate ABC transporter, permease protein PstA [Elusimicrobia bacterium RIFOXYD12_FULL_66_9]|nr:MAG: phosphate ABC transporter, permease protein PstA [Elusimicrobia bacterium RIFOXYD12_FULL_66_9]
MNDAAYARRRKVNALMFTLTGLCAAVASGTLLAILGYIAWKGALALSWSFLMNLPKPVGETGGGIANSIVGSAKVVGLAGLIGVPIGVSAGVYLAEYGRGRYAFAVRYAADVMNGVPSIVVGLFAYALIVHPMKRFSALSGSVALAFIMVPIVLRNTEEFLRLLPGTIREAALALGVPRWKVTLFVLLPTAGRGILTGALLALARVAGETAPLIFTAFGNRFWDNGWLNPIATLPHTIYTYAISPYEDWHNQAWAAALILMAFVLAVNVATRLWLRPRST